MPDHFIEPSMFSTDFRRRLEFDWPPKRIPTSKTKEHTTNPVQLHTSPTPTTQKKVR
jgi:hypothetical protein